MVLIHDVASLMFLTPFSFMCVSEVFFGYIVYPLFLTHSLFTYMSIDIVWNYLNPHSYRNLIMCHHLVCLLALSRVLVYPDEAPLVGLCGLVEIDTSLLTIRRLIPRSSSIHEMFLTLFIIHTYTNESILVKSFIYPLQIFINIFSCAICALTYSKRNPAIRGR